MLNSLIGKRTSSFLRSSKKRANSRFPSRIFACFFSKKSWTRAFFIPSSVFLVTRLLGPIKVPSMSKNKYLPIFILRYDYIIQGFHQLVSVFQQKNQQFYKLHIIR